MDNIHQALPTEGWAKPAQKAKKTYEILPKDRLALVLTALFCLLLVDTFFYHSWVAIGATVLVFFWYALVLLCTGPAPLLDRSHSVLLLFNLFLALTLGLTTNDEFRVWNSLALLILLPTHTAALSGAGRLKWWHPVMLWERFLLWLHGLFTNLGAAPAAMTKAVKLRDSRRTLSIALGIIGAGALLAALIPVLVSADALFAASTEALRSRFHFQLTGAVERLVGTLILTPFLFGLLYSLSRPKPLKDPVAEKALSFDGIAFVFMVAALDLLYLAFLTIQSAGLFGGADYLAERGISYAQWARSGFFQMAGVSVVNLTVLLGALSLSHREGTTWKLLRLLSGTLVAESLILLVSAAWRMTLYVSAYGLSFKRFMTYWGMGMMALFFLIALYKVKRPAASFCRAAFPVALAGWLVINCIPVDFLVAKNQVDRYLSGESATISVHYLAYSLSYDTLSQLKRLDPKLQLHSVDSGWWSPEETLDDLLARRAAAAAEECGEWQSWSLSAWLAAE